MSAAVAGKLAWVLMVAAWYVLRYPHERRNRRRKIARSGRDWAEKVRMLVSLSGLGLMPGIFLATGFPHFASYAPSWFQISVGVTLALCALVLFRKTHKALGKMWSVSLDIREKHTLVTTGIYQRLRHPMYTAFWTMALAQAFLLPNLVAGLSGLIGFGILFFLRVGPEEAMMEAEFGQAYRDYRARTHRIIPGIW